METTKKVTYIRTNAFLNCDCGKELMLHQRSIGSKAYEGFCSCGLKTRLKNGKFNTTPTPSVELTGLKNR